MANTLKYIPTLLLTTSFQTVYTVPASTLFTVSMLHISNNTNVDRLVQVCVVPAAGSADSTNALMYDFSIAPNNFLELLRGDIWGAGVTLQAKASAGTSVTIRISGIETT